MPLITVPPVFEHFDQIRIVNLPKRTDRRADMERQMALVGLRNDPRVAFFPAIAVDDPGPFRRAGSHGAFLSHLTLLKGVAAANQSILILQDDCDFIFPQIENYRPSVDCDIFYGGYRASDPDNLHDSDIIGAHFMGFTPRAATIATEYLTAYLDHDFRVDARAAADPDFDPAIRPPIDGAFVWMRRAFPELKTDFVMLGTQRPSRTDIGDQPVFDRIPGLRELAGMARRARWHLSREDQVRPELAARYGTRDR